MRVRQEVHDLRDWLQPRFAFVDHHRVHETGGLLTNIAEFMNGTARVVIGPSYRYPACLTPLDMQLNDPLNNRPVTIARVRVTPCGAPRGEFHCEHHRVLARIVAKRT